MLARWLIIQVLALYVGTAAPTGVAVGAVAPTRDRRDIVANELKSAVPKRWYQFAQKASEFKLACGMSIELRAAKAQSKDLGTPIQGQNWAACGRDEGQDQTDAHDDIEARGRGAPGGIYRELVTCTAKGTARWKAWRNKLLKSPNWGLYRLEYWSNPFVFPAHWEALKHDLSERGYILKVLAQDLSPEKAIYIAYDEKRNSIAWPIPGARDVTAQLLSRSDGPKYAMLVGHDPGVLQDVSIMLKAFVLPGRRNPVWVVVDELITRRTTSEQHARALKLRLRNRWQLQTADKLGARALIRCDPHGQRDNRPHQTVYTDFRNAGFAIMSAAYTKDGRSGAGWMPLQASIEMTNRLFCSAADVTRLYIGEENGKSMAPQLVHCLQNAEWDDSYTKQAGRKDNKEDDLSDPPDALRIALWAYEKVRTIEPGTQEQEAYAA